MTPMLWAVPTSPTRRMRRREAPASDSLISGPQMRAPCLLPGTVASVPSCCARNVLANGRSSSLSYGRTDYRWEAFRKACIQDTCTASPILLLFLNLQCSMCPLFCSAIRVQRRRPPMWTCCYPSALWSMHPKTARGSTMNFGSLCPMEMPWC